MRMSGEMWREAAGIKGYLREKIETSYFGTLLKYVQVILVKSPNNGGDKILTGYHLSPNEVPNTGTGLHSIEFLAKSVLWKSPNILGCGQNDWLVSTN